MEQLAADGAKDSAVGLAFSALALIVVAQLGVKARGGESGLPERVAKIGRAVPPARIEDGG